MSAAGLPSSSRAPPQKRKKKPNKQPSLILSASLSSHSSLSLILSSPTLYLCCFFCGARSPKSTPPTPRPQIRFGPQQSRPKTNPSTCLILKLYLLLSRSEANLFPYRFTLTKDNLMEKSKCWPFDLPTADQLSTWMITKKCLFTDLSSSQGFLSRVEHKTREILVLYKTLVLYRQEHSTNCIT
ncbi:uncharacterized protein [Triticum aestivum]|uniref:uncharacterized protein isoform X2 n=1 Tax=Triticum aestivum TaxID=4565 RepID=UPI001D03139D|nr:uncharacterized protein LOC123070591 isoform X2 [Triticum aestivum]